MGNYALIKDGVVFNMIVWDGPDECPLDFGEGVTYAPIPDDGGNIPAQGWIFKNGEFIRPPLTEEEQKEKEQEERRLRLENAQAEYDRSSSRITAINQQIDDEDYSDGETVDTLTAEKSKWTSYRVKIRAYIKEGDGSKELPVKPDA